MNAQYGIQYACSLMERTLQKYGTQGYTYILDWEVIEYSHPRYENKLQVVAPQVIVQFRH